MNRDLVNRDLAIAPAAAFQDAVICQHTLARPVECAGVGLHSGVPVRVRLLPADPGQGRYFVRTDVKASMPIPAIVDQVVHTQLSTELGQPHAVRTVEHLLAALWGLGLDNVRIEMDGPEVPLLDGSARCWVEAIEAAGGPVSQGEARAVRSHLPHPVQVQQGDAFVMALPASALRLSYGIDFHLPAIGNQWHSCTPADRDAFVQQIAPARTFGLADQIDYLRQQGLIRGGSLDNALVCGQQGWLNPPLRFENEPVRHKLLDLVGDLSLLGYLPDMHVVAYKASHALHVQFAQKIAQVCPMRDSAHDMGQ